MLSGQNTTNLKFLYSMNFLHKKVGGDDNIGHPPYLKSGGLCPPHPPLNRHPCCMVLEIVIHKEQNQTISTKIQPFIHQLS